MNIRAGAGDAGQRTWWQRFHRRCLVALAHYPMVVLLGVVLISIRATDLWGASAWTAMASGMALGIGGLLWRREDLRRDWGAACMAVAWMGMIGIAFGWMHDRERRAARSQLEAWNRAGRTLLSGSQENPNAWKPIAVRASVEETLRYRRSSVPRGRGEPVPRGRGQAVQRGGAVANHADGSHDPAEPWQTLTRVRVHSVRSPTRWEPSEFLASLVIDDKLRGYYPGDVLDLYGHWRLPPEPSNPGQFHLRRRYAELGLAAQLKVDSAAQLSLVAPGHTLRIDRMLARLTDLSLQTMERYVPLGQASLAAALVLGQREQAHWQLQEELLSTGTIHMLSISGMHIEMVAVAILMLGASIRAPRGITLIGTVLLCGLYALLCGANPPVARAAWMLTAGCAARLLGWPFSSLNLLAMAGLLLLTQRTTIAFEVGSQLSFLAVAVLILTFPILIFQRKPLDRLLEARQTPGQRVWSGARRFAWESLRSSFWVCFLAAPLVWHHFHILSPIAVVLNLILWLPMLMALLTGLGLIALGWLPPVAALLGMACGGSLWVMTCIVRWAEAIPWGHAWAAAPPREWMIAFYAIALAIVLWRGTKRVSARRLLIWSLGVWFALGLLYEPVLNLRRGFQRSAGRGGLAATWLDVGHGTSVVLEMPDGQVWLYDAGRLGDHERSYQPIVNALWHLGHSRLDRVLLSHADSDHYNAFPGVLERFWPRSMTTTDAVLRHPSPSIHSWLDNVKRRGVRLETWRRGDGYLGVGEWRFDVLHPSGDALHPDQEAKPRRNISDNAQSLCLAIHYAGRSIVLPGDLEPPGTDALTSLPRIDADALMAPHHGSLSADADRVVRWARPHTVVISGGTRAVNARVEAMFTPPGGRLLITARDHAVRMEIAQDGQVTWLRWQDDRWQPLGESSERSGGVVSL